MRKHLKIITGTAIVIATLAVPYVALASGPRLW